MSQDQYDAGYLPDDADCDQDLVRFHLGASHEFYTDIIEQLTEQLAKANERVKELESIQAYSEETGFIDLNKFAIEKMVEGAQRVLDCGELNLSQGDIDTIKLIQEQLRKKQGQPSVSNCGLECGAYGTYCKCQDEQLREEQDGEKT